MNFLNNPKTLTRIWAGLYCDFERVISHFMASSGWRYAHFAKICRDIKITLTLHITQGKGKSKDDHYYRFADLIFQLCKSLWLRKESTYSEERIFHVHEAMELKRTLGGFYLLYTLYEKQPIRDQVKIALGVEDMKLLSIFTEKIQVLPFRVEVEFMLAYLFQKNAFAFCVFPEDFRFDATSRYFANQSQSAIVELTRQMRDVQDAMAYSTVHKECEESFNKLQVAKNTIAKEMVKTVNESYLNKHFNGNSAFPYLVKTLSSDSLIQALKKIDNMVDKPVVTLQALTATEAVDKVLAAETRKRMDRARRKSQYHYYNDPDRDGRTSRPYVREGGIFGRKKEMDEGTDHNRRRERGIPSTNLFTYIQGFDFDKPCGKIPEPEADEAAAAAPTEENVEFMN